MKLDGNGGAAASQVMIDRDVLERISGVLERATKRWKASPASGVQELGAEAEATFLLLATSIAAYDARVRLWGTSSLPCAPAPSAPGPVRPEESTVTVTVGPEETPSP